MLKSKYCFECRPKPRKSPIETCLMIIPRCSKTWHVWRFRKHLSKIMQRSCKDQLVAPSAKQQDSIRRQTCTAQHRAIRRQDHSLPIRRTSAILSRDSWMYPDPNRAPIGNPKKKRPIYSGYLWPILGLHQLSFDSGAKRKTLVLFLYKSSRWKLEGWIFCVFPWWHHPKALRLTRRSLHPGRLTWNTIMEVWKIIFLSKWVICRFHVNLPGCKYSGELFQWSGGMAERPQTPQKNTPFFCSVRSNKNKRVQLSNHW